MQVTPKVVRLDLQYNAEQTHQYLRETFYLGPYPHEDIDHFAKRLLTLVALYETHPVMATTAAHKGPDFFLVDQHQHYLLWCELDLPSEKQLISACRRSEHVVLICDDQNVRKAESLIRGLANAEIISLSNDVVLQFQQMIKPHMHLAVWREQNSLTITDGAQALDVTTGHFYH